MGAEPSGRTVGDAWLETAREVIGTFREDLEESVDRDFPSIENSRFTIRCGINILSAPSQGMSRPIHPIRAGISFDFSGISLVRLGSRRPGEGEMWWEVGTKG